MAAPGFTLQSFLIRLVMALILVYASYNPSGYSWFHWFLHSDNRLDPLLLFSGVVLLIGWAIYLRATIHSLGALGTLLAIAFFGSFTWVLIGYGILSLDDAGLLQYVVLFMLAAVMATGLSWSHIRRRMTGQLDVDDNDD